MRPPHLGLPLLFMAVAAPRRRSGRHVERTGSYTPPLHYRISGRLNAWIWGLALPKRVRMRLSVTVYRSPPMESGLVLEIMQALASAEVPCWINGGWGVDALSARQTRIHRDLDLVLDAAAVSRAVAALAPLGFKEWYRRPSEVPLYSRVVLRDHPYAGRVIDLHPLDSPAPHVRFTSGVISGRLVSCMTVESQVSAHRKYRKRWRDRVDLAILRRLRERSQTALIVPVQAIDELRDESARDAGMPAHVTVLYPFLRPSALDPDSEQTLVSLLEEMEPFDFTLREVRRFPGVVYLAPQPAEPFIALTRTVMRRWPQHEPYGGEFKDIVPHVTVAFGETTPAGVEERLPIHVCVRELWLMRHDGHSWALQRRFALGRQGH